MSCKAVNKKIVEVGFREGFGWTDIRREEPELARPLQNRYKTVTFTQIMSLKRVMYSFVEQ
jgi:hypothetical protein